MRTETFVFRFETQEKFKEFFERYYSLDKKETDMVCLGVGTGNYLKKRMNYLN